MFKKLLVGAAASTLMVGSAWAADIEEAPPAAYDWSGAYIGAQVGYAWGPDDNIDIGGTSEFEEDMDGIVAGGHLGYNFQSDALVFGLEGDVEWTDLEAEVEEAGDTVDLNLDVLGSVRARLGYAMDNLLVYATGGLAIGSAEFEFSDGVLDESDSFTNVGYTIGGGLEYGFSESLSARIEYRYTDLGSEDIDSDIFPANDFEANLEFHAVRGGITWHFGAI